MQLDTIAPLTTNKTGMGQSSAGTIRKSNSEKCLNKCDDGPPNSELPYERSWIAKLPSNNIAPLVTLQR